MRSSAPTDDSDALDEIEQVAANLERGYATAWDSTGENPARPSPTALLELPKPFEVIARLGHLDAVVEQLWEKHPKAVAIVSSELRIKASTKPARKLLASRGISSEGSGHAVVAHRDVVHLILDTLHRAEGAPQELLIDHESKSTVLVKAMRLPMSASINLHEQPNVRYVLLLLEPARPRTQPKLQVHPEVELTRQEQLIIKALLHGDSIAEIAKSLYRSPNTIKTHARHLYAKIGVKSQRQLIAKRDTGSS
jgi:DNA-binding NarL/FixJ family response regulator